MIQMNNSLVKYFSLLLILSCCMVSHGQQNEAISTIDFVQVLNGNTTEAVYYFENNWKMLRETAIEKGYIQSFQVMETPFSEEAPFDLLLITTYTNKKQYELREENFGELIKQMGGLKLMNEKKPNEFRKTVFSKEMVRHWNQP